MSRYLRFVKIEHTLFSLPVVFAGSLLAVVVQPGTPVSISQIFWIFCAILGARSAGFGFNRVLDCAIDAKNPRTSSREIPSGKLSLRSAWTFVAAASLLFMFSALQLSPLCFWLSLVPLAL